MNDRDQWKVITKQLKSQSQSTGSYDAVVVASGHYNIPFIPQTKGINEWSKQYPGNITHSKFFRRPEDFKDKVHNLVAHFLSYTNLSRKFS